MALPQGRDMQSALQPAVQIAGKQLQPRHGGKRQLQADVCNGARIRQEQQKQSEAQGRRPVVLPPEQRREQQHSVHDHGARDRGPKAQHGSKEDHHRNADARRQPPAPQTQQAHHAEQQRHMHAGDRHDVGDARIGHGRLQSIGQAGRVARHQSDGKRRSIGRKAIRDRALHGQQGPLRRIAQRHLLRMLPFSLAAGKAEQENVIGSQIQGIPCLRHIRRDAHAVAERGILRRIAEIELHAVPLQQGNAAVAVLCPFRQAADLGLDGLPLAAEGADGHEPPGIRPAPEKPGRKAEGDRAHAPDRIAVQKQKCRGKGREAQTGQPAPHSRERIGAQRGCRRKRRGEHRENAHGPPSLPPKKPGRAIARPR